MTSAAAPRGHTELLEIARLFERTIEWEIKRSLRDGDDEGARLKIATLNQVLAAIKLATGAP